MTIINEIIKIINFQIYIWPNGLASDGWCASSGQADANEGDVRPCTCTRYEMYSKFIAAFESASVSYQRAAAAAAATTKKKTSVP